MTAARATLEEATRLLLAALAAEDLEAAAAALEARAEAIRLGGTPTREIIAAGERARLDLLALKRRWIMEGARISQLREGLAAMAPQPDPVAVDVRG